MAEYIGCYLDNNQKIHIGKIFNKNKMTFWDWLDYLGFGKEKLPEIKISIEEAPFWGITKEMLRSAKNNGRLGYAISIEGIKIPVNQK